MSRPKIFVTRRIPEIGLHRLRESCEVDVWEDALPPSHANVMERTRDCVGLLSLLSDRIDVALLDACPALRVVANYAVGFDNIDVSACTERGIAVGNTPGVLTEATADLAFCLLIAAARSLGAAERSVRAGEWRTWEPRGFVGRDLTGATLGVIGMGRIGSALARRCHAGWGMRVLYAGPRAKPDVDTALGAQHVPLPQLLGECDFLSLHAPLTTATEHVIDARALALMKPSAVLVNTARGRLVDQTALHEALASGRLFAAGLDVTDPEPLSPDHPLLTLRNCIVVPHVGSATVGARDAMAEIAADNILRGISGEPLRHAVGT